MENFGVHTNLARRKNPLRGELGKLSPEFGIPRSALRSKGFVFNLEAALIWTLRPQKSSLKVKPIEGWYR